MATFKLNTKKLFERQARRWRKEASAMLRGGRGYLGRLAPKKYKNNRPLGYGHTYAGVPGRIANAPIKLLKNGWQVNAIRRLRDQFFDEGTSRQVPRPVAGFSKKFLDRAADEVVDEIIRAGKRAKIFK